MLIKKLENVIITRTKGHILLKCVLLAHIHAQLHIVNNSRTEYIMYLELSNRKDYVSIASISMLYM